MPIRAGHTRHLSVVPDLPEDVDGRSPDNDDRTAEGDEAWDDGAVWGDRAGDQRRLVNLVLRVVLEDVEPPVWRRLRVRSDLLLSELHTVLQIAVGWQDRHLHAFSARKNGATDRFEMQETLDEDGDEGGVSEERVRVHDVLDSPGASMTYEYDLGDGWMHSIELESVDADIDDLRSACLSGARACPPEDIGGAERYSQLLGSGGELPAGFDPVRFDVPAVDAALRAVDAGRSIAAEAAASSSFVGGVLDRVRPAAVPELMALLPRCELTIESSVDRPVAEMAMKKLTWFLTKIGGDGATLTDAGYLRSAFVEAVRDELDWGLGWIGTSTREIDNHQVSDLRDAARMLGLSRVAKGRLLLTKLGAGLAGDPVGLWRHAASRLPFGKEQYERDAGVLFLVALAASASAAHRNAMLEQTVCELGWGGDGSEVLDAQMAAQSTVGFLDLIGAHGPRFYFRSDVSDSPSWSRRFARDALLS